MTVSDFWSKVKSNLELPFEIEDVKNIEWDLTGALYFDLENGKTHSLSFSECEGYDEDELDDELFNTNN